ncbi:hypothetical protein TNCV_2348081 [Trichonephila clavipes]|uniref:Uncharacterized protein n=1 Tax=Trichonephila clavipes TaxID=2585209 RepID=A0A8X6VPG0_TRICX|nr:hypothetical protein TNCV_2348081 [Trichonephila clavipes]
MVRRQSSGESRFCLQHQDCCIRVRWHHGKDKHASRRAFTGISDSRVSMSINPNRSATRGTWVILGVELPPKSAHGPHLISVLFMPNTHAGPSGMKWCQISRPRSCQLSITPPLILKSILPKRQCSGLDRPRLLLPKSGLTDNAAFKDILSASLAQGLPETIEYQEQFHIIRAQAPPSVEESVRQNYIVSIDIHVYDATHKVVSAPGNVCVY